MAGLHRFETHPAAGMSPADFCSKDAFTSADTTETNHFYYASADEDRLTGVWECAPCREVIAGYPVHEMMCILSGSVTVTVDGEAPQTFTSGDTFFIEKGTPCVWEITETLRKFYFIAS